MTRAEVYESLLSAIKRQTESEGLDPAQVRQLAEAFAVLDRNKPPGSNR